MNKNGFIFIYVLLLSFLILSIATYIFNKGVILPPFIKVVSQERQLRELSLGVVQQCIAQLAIPKKEEKNKKENDAKKQTDAADGVSRMMVVEEKKQSKISYDLELFFPELNRWHQYVLSEKIEGIDANVSICFTCEEGKFNVNHCFDFKEKKIKKDPVFDELSKVLENFQIKGLKDQLEQFFKKREKPIDDITELLQDDFFQKHFGKRIFYVPVKEGESVDKKEIYLADLFTVYNPDMQVNPLFLSDSVTQLLEFRRAIVQPVEERKKHVESIKSGLQDAVSWQAEWQKILQPMYQKPLGKLEQFFKKNLQCKLFSATCRVQIGNQQETAFVIFERKERAQDDKIMYDVAIMRLYFL